MLNFKPYRLISINFWFGSYVERWKSSKRMRSVKNEKEKENCKKIDGERHLEVTYHVINEIVMF